MATDGCLAVDDVPDGLVVAGPTGLITMVNTAAARVTGLPLAAAVGRPLDEALPFFDDAGRSWWQCADPYRGLPTRTGHPERALALSSGRLVLVRAQYVRERPLGPVVRVVVSLRANTARERAERDSAELIATVAHELRSPLTSVKGFTATLRQKWARFTDEQRLLMLETVDADADRLTRLITELLDIARIESGRLELRRQRVDVVAAIDREVASLVAAGLSGSRFKTVVEGSLPEMWLDPDKIAQVLANVLDNAVRHGSGVVTVSVAPWADGIEVTITDEGPGIPAELAERVFTKFWRGSRPHAGGTGLGLYIVKGLVEAHGGWITVGPSSSGGASFRFTLAAGKPDFD